jgi:hypothetical protein
MSSREDKQRKLRHNVEVNTERAYRSHLRNTKQSHDPKMKEQLRKDFEKSAERIERTKLHEVWN